jgi:hypothetical protein
MALEQQWRLEAVHAGTAVELAGVTPQTILNGR